MTSSSNTHLKALLRKNLILWKRSWGCSLCELIFPIIFTLLYKLLRDGTPLESVPERIFYNKPYSFEASPSADALPFIKDCSLIENSIVALAPKGDPIIENIKASLESNINESLLSIGLDFKTKYFRNNAHMDDYITSFAYENNPRICFGISLEKNNKNDVYEYHLKFNTTVNYQTGNIPDIPGNEKVNRVDTLFKDNLDTLDKYATNGTLTIQNWIDNLILSQELSSFSPKINVEISSVRIPKSANDKLGTGLGWVSQLLLVVPLLVPFIRLVGAIFREKEKRIKEGMKIMGLTGNVFYLSWLIHYGVIFTIISLCVSIILKYSVMPLSNFGLIFLWFWLCSLSTMLLGALVTTIFKTAKIGNVVSFAIIFVLAWPFQFTMQSNSLSKKVLALFGPPTSFGLVANQIFLYEAAEVGLTTETVNMEYAAFNVMYGYIIMTSSILLYIFLIFYLDAILPAEFGIRKHPLFCLKRKQAISPAPSERGSSPSSEEKNADFEDVEPSLKIQNLSIKVQNLRKVYPNLKLAVDGVTYNMYKGQIFALLGHNGAGKSSTINVITGLYPSTSGTVKVFGKDIHSDLDEIRKKLGVCPQQDVLFDNLTVKEHLELFAAFKGAKTSQLQNEIAELIDNLDLKEKTNALASSLSGGQKRRLCVGMAFVGGSEFILLDEPSSGMDPSARRKLWDMLKNSKQGRVILLTTHFMDEADYLGDRIAIMGEGKIKCMGSSLFLKNRYGEGYTLTIVKKNSEASSENITKIITEKISGAKVVSDVSAELSMQLPVQELSKFKALFETLDKNMQKLEINTYGVSVTTLEEVFLNVAHIAKANQKIDAASLDLSDENIVFDPENQALTGYKKFFSEFAALTKKKLISLQRDKRSLLLEIFVPVVMIAIGVALSLNPFDLDPISLKVSDNFYNEVNKAPYSSKIIGGSTLDSTFLDSFSSLNYNFIENNAETLQDFDNEVYQLRNLSPFPKFAFIFQEFDQVNHNYKYFLEVDTRAQDSSHFALNRMNEAILKHATGNSAKRIIVHNSPMPKPIAFNPSGAYVGITVSFSLSIGMSFIPSGVTSFISKERENNAKHQQIISGMSIVAYWASNILVDLAKYVIPCIAGPLISQGLGADTLAAGDKMDQLWQLFIFYGLAVIPFSYLLSFFQKDYTSAQTSSFFLNFGIGFIGGLALTVLDMFGGDDAIAKVVQWPLRVIPTFSLSYGFMNLSGTNFMAGNANKADDDILFLWIICIVSVVGLFAVEFIKTKKIKFFKKDIPKNDDPVDADVEEEAKRVETGAEDYKIKVRGMRKIYRTGYNKYKVAVDTITFGIQKGECFTLLGVNGAGKTTSFKMLTRDVMPSDGDIVINGHAVPNELQIARKYIGYCPQQDALFDYMTAKEHLELYAALKGIPSELRAKMIHKQLFDLNLMKFANVPAGTYSGGNKRKLSVAIALLGNPPIVFLDEPSTGMDPEARRSMWNVISNISKGIGTEKKTGSSSVILTTHSMEEAEALSTKIGIQVQGTLKCIGSIQHIKNRYGGGYEVELKIEYPTYEKVLERIKEWGLDHNDNLTNNELNQLLEKLNMKDLESELKESGSGGAILTELKTGKVSVKTVIEWIMLEQKGKKVIELMSAQFRDIMVLEHFQSFYRLRISSEFSIGQVFGYVEDIKKGAEIVQYSVKQSSIEQIFNSFAMNKIQVKPKDIIIEVNKDEDDNEVKI